MPSDAASVPDTGYVYNPPPRMVDRLKHLAGIREPDFGEGWWAFFPVVFWSMRGNPREELNEHNGVYTLFWRFPSPRSNRLQEQYGKLLGMACAYLIVYFSLAPRDPTSISLNGLVLFFVVLALAVLVGYFAGRLFFDFRMNDDDVRLVVSKERIEWYRDGKRLGVFLRSPDYKPHVWIATDEAHGLDTSRRLLRMNMAGTGDPGFKVVMTFGTFGIGWRTLMSIASTDAQEIAVRFCAILRCVLVLTDPDTDMDLLEEDFAQLAQSLNRSQWSEAHGR